VGEWKRERWKFRDRVGGIKLDNSVEEEDVDRRESRDG
jgi:hypothetical protein